MKVTERVAYLRGLFEGLGMDGDKKEGKLLKGMLEVMQDMASSISDLEEQNAELLDELDELYDDMCMIQEMDDSDEEIILDEDEDIYQVVCPTCDETIYIDEATLDEGGMQCYACGEALEFDLTALGEEDSEEPAEMAADEFAE